MFIQAPEYSRTIQTTLEEISRQDVIARIWKHDHTLWKPDPKEITNRLGWLHVAQRMRLRLGEINDVASYFVKSGCTHALLLGMGGSSLAPYLFSRTFASPTPPLELHVLDSTDPETVSIYAEKFDPRTSVYIVSSKSGNTEETLAFFRYFYTRAAASLGADTAGSHFIAITDPSSKLVELANRYRFARTILNDPDIGGRYSALSHFGLLPAAFTGTNLNLLLKRANEMAARCQAHISIENNPGAQLGAILGQFALIGRDKVTFILPPQLASFGDWVEQLLAESTGKEGRGILPVVGEPLASPQFYGDDRVFVQLRLLESGLETQEMDQGVRALEAAGQPVIRLTLKDRYDLGGQFFLWEFATAVAGWRLKINPFDQPNVEAAKVRAREMIAAYKAEGRLPLQDPSLETDAFAVYSSLPASTLQSAMRSFLSSAQKGDYLAILAFLPVAEDYQHALHSLRTTLWHDTRLPVTLGFGPRYLHSTGQLHKGGRNNGLYLLLTSNQGDDIPIPDSPGDPSASITFGVLKMAQALGDREALRDASRRVLHIHLKKDPLRTLEHLARL